jgi:hypothetical protein
MTYAKVIADSINENGQRLTTFEVEFHRFVLAEFNTHRVFSRNSASSRAIPVEKQLGRVLDEPAWPLVWACEQPGMQGGAELTGIDLEIAHGLFEAAHIANTRLIKGYLKMVQAAYPELSKEELKEHTLHKSLINRLLEPYMWHKVIVTATEWKNFFGLRCNPLAQPEIRVAAEAMRDAYEQSTPMLLKERQWHLPYLQEGEIEQYGIAAMKQVCAARCARVSYLTHDGVRDLEKDLELYARLTTAVPAHASPLEHVATPWLAATRCAGNFEGWQQLRHLEGM